MGGQRFSRGALFHLLRNPTYLGRIPHKGESYPGLHEAIVDPDLHGAVQTLLDANARRRGGSRKDVALSALAGRLHDGDGNRMSPAFSYGKTGRLYRYYVSAPLQQGRRSAGAEDTIRRVSASTLERYLTATLRAALGDLAPQPLDLLTRIDLAGGILVCQLPIAWLGPLQAAQPPGASVAPDPGDSASIHLRLPFVRRAGQAWISANAPKSGPDPVLIRALRNARRMTARDTRGYPCPDASPETPHQRRLIRLAFLAAAIQQAILQGRQPPGLTLARLIKGPIPVSWAEQARRFGFEATDTTPAHQSRTP